jgi:hypothetical protein
MSDTTRRDVLAGAAGLAATLALPAPVRALAAPLTYRPSLLLFEFRRRAAEVLAIEAMDPHDPMVAPRLPELAAVSRQIWSTPAITFSSISARAELAKFWNRHGLGYQDYHGYDDEFANMRLIDAVLVVPTVPESIPPFDPPPALLEWRRLDAEWARRYALRKPTLKEQFANSDAMYRCEDEALKNPATCWADIVVRAELTSARRRSYIPEDCCWIRLDADDDQTRFTSKRAFAELLNAIRRLGACPPFA